MIYKTATLMREGNEAGSLKKSFDVIKNRMNIEGHSFFF